LKSKGSFPKNITGGGESMAKELKSITPSNLARYWGVSLKKVQNAIKEAGIEPNTTRGTCKYYTEADMKKIQQALNIE
jgi:hypothetical protein